MSFIFQGCILRFHVKLPGCERLFQLPYDFHSVRQSFLLLPEDFLGQSRVPLFAQFQKFDILFGGEFPQLLNVCKCWIVN